MAAELTPRAGSLFPGEQDIVCLSRTFFFFWEVKEKQVETLTQIAHKPQAPISTLSSALYIFKHILTSLAHLQASVLSFLNARTPLHCVVFSLGLT